MFECRLELRYKAKQLGEKDHQTLLKTGNLSPALCGESQFHSLAQMVSTRLVVVVLHER